MKTYFDPDDGTGMNQKRCAICGKIDDIQKLSFKKTQFSPVQKIKGIKYQIPIWVCKDCDK